MQVRFYGTRGSLPTSADASALRLAVRDLLAEAIERGLSAAEVDAFLENARHLHFHGGNTACVRLQCGDDLLILDAGSGLRQLGLDLVRDGVSFVTRPCHLLLSHTHWDHICGFPFFVPLYRPDNQFCIASAHPDVRKALRRQQSAPCFPVPFEALPATLRFRKLLPQKESTLGGFRVTSLALSHPNGCFGYRIERDGVVVVYMTDAELPSIAKDELETYRDFIRGASLVIADCQYTFPDNYKKRTWGHSSVFAFIDLCANLDIKNLAMFHHEPAYTDEEISRMEATGREYLRINGLGATFHIFAAYDGLTMDLAAAGSA